MSALQRARRSTSRTAPDAGGDIQQSNGTIPASNSDPADPSSPPEPSHPAAPASLPDPNAKIPALDNVPMLSTLSAAVLMASEQQNVDNDFEDHADNGSSSLSELGDASDEHSEPTPRPLTAADLSDADSEAETERLEATPRKLTRTATETSLASEQLYQRTPSKLIHSKTIDAEESAPPTPSVTVEDSTIGEAIEGNTALHALSLAASSEAATLAELAGKKRKRSSRESSSLDEQVDEPARKRCSTAKASTHGNGDAMVDSSEQVDIEEELDNAEERISQLAQEEIELEERQADIAAEAVSEMATVAKHTKPRKGGRRGKRKMEDIGHTNNDAVASIEPQDGEGDGDNEDDDSAAHDEEVAKKKLAIDELAKIEKKFKIFREKLCDEQIAQYEQELEMLRQPNCVHPEYLAMIKCIDDRRAEKIAYEKTLLQFKQKNLEVITTAERHQLHSQYFQTVRDVREDILSDCNKRIFDLQRGRRQLGIEEVEYIVKLPEKRSDQIRHQAAYNLELSILSGVAKYVGFPAAPEISAARPSEIDDDLRAMKIATRPAAPVPYVRPAYARNSTADEAAAEEQFFERTPWANPQHPAHQQSHYGVAPVPSRVPSYHTPVVQRRLDAPNGSASTLEANSNPPSSTAGGPHHTNSGRIGQSESPVLQMKRHPSEHQSYAESPGSHPRNVASLLGRESYAMPSPAGAHVEQPDEQGPRWGAMRPLNAGASPAPSMQGRPDPARVPLTQRSGLGTVSIGSGNPLFGR